VVIFVHFCDMFVCVRSLVTLFWMFHVQRWSEKGSSLIDVYYFQIRAKGLIMYIAPISSDKWDRWRED
jgi:hypothetical protein